MIRLHLDYYQPPNKHRIFKQLSVRVKTLDARVGDSKSNCVLVIEGIFRTLCNISLVEKVTHTHTFGMSHVSVTEVYSLGCIDHENNYIFARYLSYVVF